MAFENENENECERAQRVPVGDVRASAPSDNAYDDALMRVALARDLLLAERLLPRDPDAAALLLDGAPRRIVVSWLALRGAPHGADSLAGAGDSGAPNAISGYAHGDRLSKAGHEERGDDLLAQVERVAPAVAWRLRLALRAPHAEARLAHCWALLRAALATTTAPPRANLAYTRPTRQGSARTLDATWQAPT